MKFWRKVLMIAVAATLGAGFFAGDAEAAFLDSVVVVTPDSGGIRGIDSTIVVRAYLGTGLVDDNVEMYFWLAGATDAAAVVPLPGARDDIENQIATRIGATPGDPNFVAARVIGMHRDKPDTVTAGIGDAQQIIITPGPVRTPATAGTYIITATFKVDHTWPERTGVVAWATVFDPQAVGSAASPDGWETNKAAVRGHKFEVDGKRPILDPAKVTLLNVAPAWVDGIPRWTKGYTALGDTAAKTMGVGDTVAVELNLGDAFQDAIALRWGVSTRLLYEGADPVTILLRTPGEVGGINRQIDTYNAIIQEGMFPNLTADRKLGEVAVFVTDRAGNLSIHKGMLDSLGTDAIPYGLTQAADFLIDAKTPLMTAAGGDTIFPAANDTISRGRIRTLRADYPSDINPFAYKFSETLSKLQLTFESGIAPGDAPHLDPCDDDCMTPPAPDYFIETYTINATTSGDASGTAIALDDVVLRKDAWRRVDWTPGLWGGISGSWAQGGVLAMDGAFLQRVVAEDDRALPTGLYTMTVKGVDLAGNSSTVATPDVYVDVDPIVLADLFPVKEAFGPVADARLDTIEAVTAQVRFKLSEPADSVVIRYKGLLGNDINQTRKHVLSGSQLVNTTSVQMFAIDSLVTDTKYELTVLARDLAGNYSMSGPDTFWYDATYQPPLIQRFAITSDPVTGRNPDCHLEAGTPVILTIEALASLQDQDKRQAVTYRNEAVLKIEGARGLTVDGVAVEDGRVILDADGWRYGKRDVVLNNTTAVDTLWVTVVDSTDAPDRLYAGMLSNPIVYMPGPYAKIMVSAPDTVGQGVAFQVDVKLVDQFGNLRYVPAGTSYCSDPELEPCEYPGITISRYVDIVANKLGAEVPTGNRLYVSNAHGMFDARVNAWQGDGLVFRVIDAREMEHGQWEAADDPWPPEAKFGLSNAITVVAPELIATLDAPDTLIAKDYMGADGQGDQGGFVMMTWDLSEDHEHLTGYRIYRELMVDYTTDEDGKLVELTNSTMDWVPWAKVDAVPGANIGRAIVATLDNVATHWGIAAERGRQTTAVAAKEIFEAEAEGTDEPVFAVLTSEALAFIENGTAIQAKFVDGLLRSEITATVEPVRAIDNIPPKPVPFLRAMDTPSDMGGSITLSWTQSEDDRLLPRFHAAAVGPTTADQVPGVLGYNIYRKVGNQSFTLIGKAAAGETSFADATALNGVRYTYQVRPYDLDNETAAVLERTAMAIRNIVFDAAGERIYGLFGMTNQVGFDDFFIFADNFGLTRDDPAFEPAFDLTGSGRVDFDDFFVFADNFGRVARLAAGKAVPTLAGLNRDARLYLDAGTQLPRVGEEVVVDISLADFVALKGYGFNVSFDAEQLEFVKVVADNNPLGEGVLAQPLVIAQNDGNVAIAAHGETVSQGELGVSLVFRTRTEIENTFIEVNQSEVRDDSYGTNQVSLPAPVQIQTLPAQYALGNNYPNPFNPATTIRYALPEAAFVKLEIYNVVGQVVRTLVADQQNAGRYVAQWNASDDNGRSLSSGIYFYRLQAGSEFREVKKMLLLK